MSCRVVKEFADSQDRYYVYQAGDLFPRDGKQVDEKRIRELKEKSFIEEVTDERKAEEAEKPKKTKAKQKE